MSDWQDLAACKGAPDGIFYAPDGEGPGGQNTRIALARSYCDRCPVKALCAEAGMGDAWGVWGGLTETQRHKIRQERAKRNGLEMTA